MLPNILLKASSPPMRPYESNMTKIVKAKHHKVYPHSHLESKSAMEKFRISNIAEIEKSPMRMNDLSKSIDKQH